MGYLFVIFLTKCYLPGFCDTVHQVSGAKFGRTWIDWTAAPSIDMIVRRLKEAFLPCRVTCLYCNQPFQYEEIDAIFTLCNMCRVRRAPDQNYAALFAPAQKREGNVASMPVANEDARIFR